MAGDEGAVGLDEAAKGTVRLGAEEVEAADDGQRAWSRREARQLCLRRLSK
jgi:hypothetical protein